VFAHYITQRTRELVDTVHREGFSTFPQALPARDHPDALEQSVQGLILTLKQMADESYQEKLNAKRMELQLLQAQINPHFLYNAIDAIYWKAIRQDVPEIAQLLSVLARYFRLTLNKGRDVVPLGDEVALLRAYIALQKNRFDDRFSVAYEVEDEALSALLPKLTLQPLVENARGPWSSRPGGRGASCFARWRTTGPGSRRPWCSSPQSPARAMGCTT